MAGYRHRRLLLLPAGADAITALQQALGRQETNASTLVAKWKVGVLDPDTELQLLEQLLEQLPTGALLRLDANGGWDRATAGRWAMRLQNERKLQWLEQPLPPSDHAGLLALGRRLPVALDESLRHSSGLPSGWSGWLAHKPALEGDPRPLCCRNFRSVLPNAWSPVPWKPASVVAPLPTWRP